MFAGWSPDILGMHLGNCSTMQPVSFQYLVGEFTLLQELALAHNHVNDHGELCRHAVSTAILRNMFQPVTDT